MKTEAQWRSEDGAKQARSKRDIVDRPVRTARIFVHQCNSTQYCKTESFFSIFPLLQAFKANNHHWLKDEVYTWRCKN